MDVTALYHHVQATGKCFVFLRSREKILSQKHTSHGPKLFHVSISKHLLWDTNLFIDFSQSGAGGDVRSPWNSWTERGKDSIWKRRRKEGSVDAGHTPFTTRTVQRSKKSHFLSIPPTMPAWKPPTSPFLPKSLLSCTKIVHISTHVVNNPFSPPSSSCHASLSECPPRPPHWCCWSQLVVGRH